MCPAKWCSSPPRVCNNDHGRDKARACVERNLKTIGIDWLDFSFILWPVPSQAPYVETWQTFIEMRSKGLLRSIGVSTFNADHLKRNIEETGEKPVLNQFGLTPEPQPPEMRAANARHWVVTRA